MLSPRLPLPCQTYKVLISLCPSQVYGPLPSPFLGCGPLGLVSIILCLILALPHSSTGPLAWSWSLPHFSSHLVPSSGSPLLRCTVLAPCLWQAQAWSCPWVLLGPSILLFSPNSTLPVQIITENFSLPFTIKIKHFGRIRKLNSWLTHNSLLVLYLLQGLQQSQSLDVPLSHLLGSEEVGIPEVVSQPESSDSCPSLAACKESLPPGLKPGLMWMTPSWWGLPLQMTPSWGE